MGGRVKRCQILADRVASESFDSSFFASNFWFCLDYLGNCLPNLGRASNRPKTSIS